MNPLYENDLIYLTPFNADLAEKGEPYRGWFHDADVTRLNSHGLFPYGEKALQAFLESLDDGTKAVFAIMTNNYPDGEDIPNLKHPLTGIPIHPRPIHIGNCSLQQIDWVSRSAEFAIVIGNTSYWKKGIATMCLEFMLEHGFNRMNLHRIWTGTVGINLGMRNVAVKCGMAEEGRFSQASFLRGAYHDIVTYGILKSEWRGRKTNENE